MTDTKKTEIKKISPEQIKKKREAAKAAVAMLADAYPDVFDLENPKPLKIGIHHDLTEDAKISKTQMRKALSAYTRHYKYISCLVTGGFRVNLKGEEGDEVSAEEITHAKDKIDAIDKIKSDRKKQQENRKKQQVKRRERDDRLDNKLAALVAKSTK